MDSGNSGSIQSEGEEARCHGFGSFPAAHHQNPGVFDPSLIDLHDDLMWLRSGGSGRSDPYFGTLISTVPESSPLEAVATQPNPTAAVIQATSSQPPKNPRKRTRASRRAPTTVMATDISNFRQMVQEFTGIPASPLFSSTASSSSPYSRRFDLFSAALQYPPAAAAAFKFNPSSFASPSPAPVPLNQAAIGNSNSDAGSPNNIPVGNYGGDHQLLMSMNDLNTAGRNDGGGYGQLWWRNGERGPNPGGVEEIEDGDGDGDDGRGRGVKFE